MNVTKKSWNKLEGWKTFKGTEMKATLVILITLLMITPVFADLSSETLPETTACDGGTTAFPFSFSIVDTSDIYAILRLVSTGVETDLVEDVNYTVSAINNDYSSGGTVTTIQTFPSTYTLTIGRSTPRTQATVLADTEVLRLAALEAAYDKLTRIMQELYEISTRTLQLPRTETGTAELLNSIDRAETFLWFDSAGDVNGTATMTFASVAAAETLTAN